MTSMVLYLVQVIICSGILYVYYHAVLRNKKFHQYNRYYLLLSTVLSLAIPLLNIPFYFTEKQNDSSFLLQTLTVFSPVEARPVIVSGIEEQHAADRFGFVMIIQMVYFFIVSLLLVQLIISLIRLKRLFKSNPSKKMGKIFFINTEEPGTPFSFFKWLFWNNKIALHSENGEKIFRHELFHIKHQHSLDILYLELLTAIAWFNPIFYLMKKEVKAIHEFLADQYAMNENNRWEYAELLVMQALNTRHKLINPFFHNQIKRRISMITTLDKPSFLYIRKLMVLPIVVIIITLFAFNYKNSVPINENDVLSDTIKPKLEFIKDAITGKEKGLYNNREFTRILIWPPTGQLSFIYLNGDLEMISKSESEELKNR